MAEIIRLDGHHNPFVNQLQNEINELLYNDKYRHNLSLSEVLGIFEVIKWDVMANEQD